LLSLGLIDKLATCIHDGTVDAKIQAVAFLLDLSKATDFPLLEIVVNCGLLDELVYVIPQVSERSGLTILRLIWRCIRIAQSAGTVEVLAEYLETREVRAALEDVAEDPRPLIANTARNCLSELGPPS
jgi:hypothetical protein